MRARSPVAQILAAAQYGGAQPRENASSVFLLNFSVHGVLASPFSRSDPSRSPHNSCGQLSSSGPESPGASGLPRHLSFSPTLLGPDSSQRRKREAHGRSSALSWAEHWWLITPRGNPAPPCSPSGRRAPEAANAASGGGVGAKDPASGSFRRTPGEWTVAAAEARAAEKRNGEASVEPDTRQYEPCGPGGQPVRSGALCLKAQSATSSPFPTLPSSSMLRSLHTRAMTWAAPATGDTPSADSSLFTAAAREPDRPPDARASTVSISWLEDPLQASTATPSMRSRASPPAINEETPSAGKQTKPTSPAANEDRLSRTATPDSLSAGQPHDGTGFGQGRNNQRPPTCKTLLSCVAGVDLRSCALADGQVSMDLVVAQIQKHWVRRTGARSPIGRQQAPHGGVAEPDWLRKAVTMAVKEINDPRLARGLLQWAREEQGMELDPLHVTVLINALARAGDLEGVMSFEDSLHRDGFPLNDINYSALMTSYHSLGRTALAFSVPRTMKARGEKMGTATFNSLMSISLKSGWLLRTWDLFHERQRRGIQPNLVTYNILIEACRVSRDVKSAKTTLDKLLNQGLIPDDFTVNSLLLLYKETGNTREAAALFASLRDHGLDPSVFSKTTYLDILCKQGLIEAAESVLQELPERQLAGCAAAAWSSMVHMYGARVGPQEALQCFLRAVLSGAKPDSRLYISLVYALVLGESFAEAGAVLEFLEARSATPRIAISCILLNMCTSAGPDSGKLLILLELLKLAGGEVKDLILQLISAEIHVGPTKRESCELEFDCSVLRSQQSESSLMVSAHSNAHTEAARDNQHGWDQSLILLNKLLDSRELNEDKQILSKSFGDSLQQFLLWAGLEKSADVVWNVLLNRGLFVGKVSFEPSHWTKGVCTLDLHGVNPEATAFFVRGVLERLRELHATRNVVPSEIQIITGWGKGSASFNKPVEAEITAREVVESSLKTLGLDATPINRGCFSVSGASLAAWMRDTAKEEKQTSSSTNIRARNIQRCLQEPIDASRFMPNAPCMEILNKALSLLGAAK